MDSGASSSSVLVENQGSTLDAIVHEACDALGINMSQLEVYCNTLDGVFGIKMPYMAF